MADTLIITRPRAQAEPLAQLISTLGYKPVIFPLFEIEPIADPTELLECLAKLEQYAMVAFVSPNAIDAVFSRINRWPQAVAIAVMGEGSRRALARHGLTDTNAEIFCPDDPNQTDSQTLLKVLNLDQLRGKQVLIVRGEAGRELLAQELRTNGTLVKQVAAYRRLAPELTPERCQLLQELIAMRCGWIITSSEALQILMKMVRDGIGNEGVAALQQLHILVPHRRIQETAQLLGCKNVTLTRAGDEGILAALQ